MQLIVECERRRIKAGCASSAPAFGVAAHGMTMALADANLVRTIRLFLAPLARAGTLQDEAARLGRVVADGQDEVRVELQRAGPGAAEGAQDV